MRVLDKEGFLVEVEKAMAKERYGRIGKENEEQEPPGKEQEQHQPEQTTTDRNIDKEEEW